MAIKPSLKSNKGTKITFGVRRKGKAFKGKRKHYSSKLYNRQGR